METNRIKRKKNIKTVLVAVAIIGVCALAFQIITKALAKNELSKEKEVPTNYTNIIAETMTSEEEDIPDGYTKTNYTIVYWNSDWQKPTSVDITKEEAAEIGAKELYKIFGVDLEGQEIEMSYCEASYDKFYEEIIRSLWIGQIYISDDVYYAFNIDSISGEILTVFFNRIPDNKMSDDFDSDLSKNHQEYIDLATNIAEKYDIVNGPIKSVEYECQRFRRPKKTEPFIAFNVVGENKKFAQITFSTDDKKLLSIAYDGGNVNERQRKLEEIDKKVFEMYFNDHPEIADKNAAAIDEVELYDYYERLRNQIMR